MAWFWFFVAVVLAYQLSKASGKSVTDSGKQDLSSGNAPRLEEKIAEISQARDQAMHALELEELKTKDQANTINRE